MPVSFPLDKIPALPNQAVALIVDQIVKFINKIQVEIEKVISDCAKLPDNCNCDSPDIQDLLERIENIKNVIPYGDRSNSIIEPLLTEQWFVNAKQLSKKSIKIVNEGKTSFFPNNWTKIFLSVKLDLSLITTGLSILISS